MVLRAITTHLVNRHVAKRLTRMIPHPGLRLVATFAASVVVPVVVERTLAHRFSRKGRLTVGRRVATGKSAS